MSERRETVREQVLTIVSDLLAEAEGVFRAYTYVKGSADDGDIGPIELDEALAETAAPFEERLIALVSPIEQGGTLDRERERLLVEYEHAVRAHQACDGEEAERDERARAVDAAGLRLLAALTPSSAPPHCTTSVSRPEERDVVIEECIRAVCRDCATGKALVTLPFEHMHTDERGKGYWCEASALHYMLKELR